VVTEKEVRKSDNHVVKFSLKLIVDKNQKHEVSKITVKNQTYLEICLLD
jgi:hypothetical protein